MQTQTNAPVKDPLAAAATEPELVQMLTALARSGFAEQVVQNPRSAYDEPPTYNIRIRPRSPYTTEGYGHSLENYTSALWKAAGELIERNLWHQATTSDKTVPADTIDLSALAGFSSQQRTNHSALSFTNSDFGVTRVTNLRTNSQAYYPTQLFARGYLESQVRWPAHPQTHTPDREPLLRWPITTGLGSGLCLSDAIVSGALEVIERDAFILTYLHQCPPPRLNLDALRAHSSVIDAILDRYERYELSVHLVQLFSDAPIPSYAAVIIDRSGVGPAFSVAARTHTNPVIGLLDSLAEAQSSRNWLRRVGHLHQHRKPIDKAGRLCYWSRLENLPKIEWFVSGPEQTIFTHPADPPPPNTTNQRYPKSLHTELTSWLQNSNIDMFYHRLTSKASKRVGFETVCVASPQLQPLSLMSDIPYEGGARLANPPAIPNPRPANALNPEPHPFG